MDNTLAVRTTGTSPYAQQVLESLQRKRARDPEATVLCPNCPDKFKTSQGMNYHRAKMHPEIKTKLCPVCGVDKCFSDYYMRGAKPRAQCKSCDHILNYGSPERTARRSQIQYVSEKCRRHGITRDDLAALWDRCGGLCEVCGQSARDGISLSLDHCHMCKKVRGFLCQRCNAGIGNFRDSSEWLRLAAEYLDARDSCGGGGPSYDGGTVSWNARRKQKLRRQNS
jgi:hypothetical protein